jgi:hypothetical protein
LARFSFLLAAAAEFTYNTHHYIFIAHCVIHKKRKKSTLKYKIESTSVATAYYVLKKERTQKTRANCIKLFSVWHFTKYFNITKALSESISHAKHTFTDDHHHHCCL